MEDTAVDESSASRLSRRHFLHLHKLLHDLLRLRGSTKQIHIFYDLFVSAE